jgi:hypothetical protein
MNGFKSYCGVDEVSFTKGMNTAIAMVVIGRERCGVDEENEVRRRSE